MKVSGRGASLHAVHHPIYSKTTRSKSMCRYCSNLQVALQWGWRTLVSHKHYTLTKKVDVPSHPKKPRNSNSVCKCSQAFITTELPYKIQRLYKEKLPDISWCNTNSSQVKNNKFGCCDTSVEAWLDTCLAQHCWFLWKVNWRTKGHWNGKK